MALRTDNLSANQMQVPKIPDYQRNPVLVFENLVSNRSDQKCRKTVY